MAYALVQDIPATWGTYREIARILEGSGPEGLVLHAAGPTDEGFRMIGVWESHEAWCLFRGDRLDPILEAIAGGSRFRATLRELEIAHLVPGIDLRPRQPLAGVHNRGLPRV